MTTYEQLDRTIYELLRRELVRLGYLPDRKILTAGQYTIAKDALLQAGNLIELFGMGSAESRDKKQVDRITIERKNATRGTLGAFGLSSFKPVIDPLLPAPHIAGYVKSREPSGNKNVEYEVRLICATVKRERIVTDIINTALGFLEYVVIVDPLTLDDIPNKVELLASGGDVDVSSTEFIERLFTYQFNEVWVDASRPEIKVVSPILEVEWNNTFPTGTPPDNQNNVLPD